MKNSKLFSALALALTFACVAPTFTFAQDASAPNKEEMDKLIATLKSEASQKDKADACRLLGIIGDKDAVPVLASLLGDEKMAHMARYALEPIPGAEVDNVFRSALNQLHGRPLIGVITSVGVRHDAQAISQLTALMFSAEPGVGPAAANSLGSIGTAPAAKALQAAWANTPAPGHLVFAEGMLRCAEGLSNKGLRKEALAIYDTLADAKVPHQVRAGALRGAILNRPSDQAMTLLKQSLHGTDFVLVDAAIRAAMEMPGREVTSALVSAINTYTEDQKLLVIQALGKRHEVAIALESLNLECSMERPRSIRLAAIRALTEIGSAYSVPKFTSLMNDSDPEVAQAAQEALASMKVKEANETIMNMLASNDAAKQLNGIELIGRRRMVEALPELLNAGTNSDVKVRVAAVKRIGELGGTKELPALIGFLNSGKDSQDTEAAQQALVAICGREQNTDESAAKLVDALGSAETAQKLVLLRTLGSIGGQKPLKAVRAAVDDSNADIHTAALRELSSWKTTDALPELLGLAKSAANPTDKMVCLRGYLSWAGDNELPAAKRLAMCQDIAPLVQQPDEKKLLLGTLGGITSPDAVTAIAPYLGDDAVKEEASAATVSIAEKILKDNKDKDVAAKLTAPLQKAAEVTGNTGLAQRAKALALKSEGK
jgi:HEAT repeat protein